MELTFLGTAAATSCPLAFCRCAACTYARRNGGYDLRLRSSLLVNDDLLIDLGPDLMAASFTLGLDVTRIRYLLQTHSHSDHFDAGHLITRMPEYACMDTPPLAVFASGACIDHMSDALAREETGARLDDASWQEKLNLTVCPVRAFEPFSAGPYTVTALPSDHDRSDESMLYLISDGGACVFYGVDTPLLRADAWAYLTALPTPLDAAILDQTYGPGVDGGGHLNADQTARTFRRMREEGILKRGARAFATHLSHEGTPPHAEISAFARVHGFEITYDGLRLAL